jgi:hypothetical protein
MNIMNVIKRKALAKFVPAAAVKRIERVLFIGTRCKERKAVLKIFGKRLGFKLGTTKNKLMLDYCREIRYF